MVLKLLEGRGEEEGVKEKEEEEKKEKKSV